MLTTGAMQRTSELCGSDEAFVVCCVFVNCLLTKAILANMAAVKTNGALIFHFVSELSSSAGNNGKTVLVDCSRQPLF